MGLTDAERRAVIRELGLPRGVDDMTLNFELSQARSTTQGRQALVRAQASLDAAERDAQTQDRQIVMAAVSAGKVPANRAEFWCSALQDDRDGNRAILAALAPGVPQTEQFVVDEGVAGVHNAVMRRLGVPEDRRPRAVAAAAADVLGKPLVDDLGLEIDPMPAPVRMRKGTPPSQWTQQQHSDNFMHQLGARFSQGVTPPPAQDAYYQPSPDDMFEYVEKQDGTVEFREKDMPWTNYD